MSKKAGIFFLIFLASCFISLCFNFSKINIPYFGSVYKKIQLDIIYKDEKNGLRDFSEISKNVLKIQQNHYLYDLKPIKEININTKNIDSLILYEGNEARFYKSIPAKITVNPRKSFLNTMGIVFLSFFYNIHLFWVCYIFLFLFLKNLKTKHIKIPFLSLFILCVLLRIIQINNIPFWDDEIYVIVHTSSGIKALFNDAGNPPLYYILFKIYRSFITNSVFWRYFSVIIGSCFCALFYLYTKKWFNNKKALISLFIVSINIPLIYLSQELRCYSLLILLCLASNYLLFKFNKKNAKKYLICSVFLLYTHFYGAIYLFYNFLFGISLFYKNKQKIFRFIKINLISYLMFLPLLISKIDSITSSFNSWMKPPKWADIDSVFNLFINNKICLVLFVVCLIFIYINTRTKKGKLFIKYNGIAILGVLLFSYLFSYIIKPIFFYKYFYCVYPNFILLVLYMALYKYKKSARLFMGFVIIILFVFNSKLSYQNLFCNHNIFIDYVKSDIVQNKRNYVFLSDTIEGYADFIVKNAETIYLPINKGISEFNLKRQNLKYPCVIYVMNLYLDNETYNKAKKIKLFKSPLGVFTKIVI